MQRNATTHLLHPARAGASHVVWHRAGPEPRQRPFTPNVALGQLLGQDGPGHQALGRRVGFGVDLQSPCRGAAPRHIGGQDHAALGGQLEPMRGSRAGVKLQPHVTGLLIGTWHAPDCTQTAAHERQDHPGEVGGAWKGEGWANCGHGWLWF